MNDIAYELQQLRKNGLTQTFEDQQVDLVIDEDTQVVLQSIALSLNKISKDLRKIRKLKEANESR